MTATRLEATAQQTPGARVIDRDALDQRGAAFAADILADVPGLSVVRSGAFGGVAQVRMRGASPGKTLVLVDGVPQNDPAEINGAFDFSGFELSDVERIEVLSGPQSALWGSDAIGGVIAFTTRELDGLEADLETGSYATRRGRIGFGRVAERFALGGWISRFESAGVSAADEADGASEADGLNRTAAGARGRLALGAEAEVSGSVRWSDARAELDGFPAPSFVLADTSDVQRSEQWSGTVSLSLPLAGLRHRLSVSASALERDTVSDFPSHFEGDRQVYRWQAEGRAPRLAYTFGAEYGQSEGLLSSGLAHTLDAASLFGVARAETGPFSFTGGLRRDDVEGFGARTTGRVSTAWSLGAGLTLSGAWGTGFKAPTVSQAVCDYCWSPLPWPELRAETADSFEGALGWASADGRFDGRATVYRLNVENQIAYVDGRYINIDRTRTDGIELEGRMLLTGGLDLAIAYAWTDAVDATTGRRLLRVPEHAASATLGWTGERLNAALTVRTEGDQDDTDNGAPVVRSGFLTAHLNAAWALTQTVSLTARLENLTDEAYQQVFGYGEPGRSGYLGLRLRY